MKLISGSRFIFSVFLLALPLAASTLQSGVSVTESNCVAPYCTVSAGYRGFGTDTFSGSVIAEGSNFGGASAQGKATIDVTGATTGPLESGWIVFGYPCCNGMLNGGGEAESWFEVGAIEGGPMGESGIDNPRAGTLVPFETGEAFDISLLAEFYAPAGGIAAGASAELALSFQIFNSAGDALTIYDPPGMADAPEPATWGLLYGGMRRGAGDRAGAALTYASNDKPRRRSNADEVCQRCDSLSGRL